MNITELAMAKKLFGGGGGKRGGTAIPVGQPVERIYFNIHNSIEETNALLSQLTYVQTPLMEHPICAIYANTADGNSGSFIFATKEGEDEYGIWEVWDIANNEGIRYFDKPNTAMGEKVYFNGWEKRYKLSSHYGYYMLPSGIEVFAGGQSLTDFSGLPVGAENEKIKNVLSITPF